MEQEIWKPIPGYEGLYEASNLGRLRTLPRSYDVQIRTDCKITVKRKQKILKNYVNDRGYVYANLFNKRYKTYQVHVLIAMVFLNNGEVINGLQVNHIDGNKSNNKINNLELISASENQLHRRRNQKFNFIIQRKDYNRLKPFYYQFTYNGKRVRSVSFFSYNECKDALLLKLKELNYKPKYLKF